MSHPPTASSNNNNTNVPEQYPVEQQPHPVSMDLPNESSCSCQRWIRCSICILFVSAISGFLIAIMVLVPGATIIIGRGRFRTPKYHHNAATTTTTTNQSPGGNVPQQHPPSRPTTPTDPVNVDVVVAPPPPPSPPPTPSYPTLAASRTQDEIYGIVTLIQSKTLSGHFLRYPLTPDSMDWTREEWALQWLIEDDPARLNATLPAGQLWLVERYALATLYLYHYNVYDDTHPWTYSTGWFDNWNECEWYGVSCTEYDLGYPIGIYSPVTSLVLTSNNLIGMLPPDIGLLSYLTEFRIDENDVRGALPESIGLWTYMQTFDVSYNSNLMGPMPLSIQRWNYLDRITLSYTALTGVLPPNICSADSIPCDIECICCTYPYEYCT